MKNIFLFSFFFSLFLVSQSSAQWWVQGGNLLWPYGDVDVKGKLTSSDYQHIILRFEKNGDDSEFFLYVYRNDTQTTIDTVYWTGGAYGTDYYIEFSDDVVDGSNQYLYFFVSYINCWSVSSFVPVDFRAMRSGADNRILFNFIDSSGNKVDVFTVSLYVDLIIVPNSSIDSFSLFW